MFYLICLIDGLMIDYYGGLFDVLLGVLLDSLTGVFDDELAKLLMLINYQNAC